MDGLRIFAKRDLDRLSKFFTKEEPYPSKGTLSLIRATVSASNEPYHHVLLGSEETILRQLENSSRADEEHNFTPSLTLVVIPRESRGVLFISKESFLRIFERFHIDPYVLHLVSVSAGSLHHDPHPYESCYTSYVGSFLYTVMWSFNPVTMTTCGFLLPRINLWAKLGIDGADNLGQVLEVYQKHLYTLVLLIFVTLIHLTHMLDDFMRAEVAVIKETGQATLHNPDPMLRKYIGINQLSDFAGVIEESLGHLSDHSRLPARLGLGYVDTGILVGQQREYLVM